MLTVPGSGLSIKSKDFSSFAISCLSMSNRFMEKDSHNITSHTFDGGRAREADNTRISPVVLLGIEDDTSISQQTMSYRIFF